MTEKQLEELKRIDKRLAIIEHEQKELRKAFNDILLDRTGISKCDDCTKQFCFVCTRNPHCDRGDAVDYYVKKDLRFNAEVIPSSVTWDDDTKGEFNHGK